MRIRKPSFSINSFTKLTHKWRPPNSSQIILEIAAIGLFAQKAVHNIANKMAIAI